MGAVIAPQVTPFLSASLMASATQPLTSGPSSLTQTQSGCVALYIPVTLNLTGGITAAAALKPSVGILLRLYLSCYLGIPLVSTLITGSTDDSASDIVTPGDAVNAVDGNCSAQVGGGSRILRQRLHNANSRGGRYDRVLDASGAAGGSQKTAVTLLLVITTCATVRGTPAVSPQLSALLDSLAFPAANVSAFASGSLSLLGLFVAAAANASGVPMASVSAVLSVGKPYQPVASVSAQSSPYDNGSSSATVVAAACGAIAAGLVVILVTALLVAHRRRIGMERHSKKCLSSTNARAAMEPTGSKIAGFEEGVNPLHQASGSAADKRTGRSPSKVGVASVLQRNPMHGGVVSTASSGSDAVPLQVGPRKSTSRLYPVPQDAGRAGAHQTRQHRDLGVLDGAHSSADVAPALVMTSNPMMAGRPI